MCSLSSQSRCCVILRQFPNLWIYLYQVPMSSCYIINLSLALLMQFIEVTSCLSCGAHCHPDVVCHSQGATGLDLDLSGRIHRLVQVPTLAIYLLGVVCIFVSPLAFVAVFISAPCSALRAVRHLCLLRAVHRGLCVISAPCSTRAAISYSLANQSTS